MSANQKGWNAKLFKTVCVGLMAGLVWAGSARAQTSGPTIKINSDPCNSEAYPAVSCLVTPINSAGVPLQGLNAPAFQVVDNATPLQDLAVETVTNTTDRTSFMLVVDFGMTGGNRRAVTVEDLKEAARSLVGAIGDNDRIGLLGVTGKIEMDAAKLDDTKELKFESATQRNAFINTINKLPVVAGTPLYDAVCKALLLTSQEGQVGNRVVIVLSDGRDVGSRVCKADDPIVRGRADRIPVFTIGVGPRIDAYLQRLALQTDGEYLVAGASAEILPTFKKFQERLKTQYKLSFKGLAEPDNKNHAITVRFNHPSGNVSEQGNYIAALPIVPSISLAFEVNGAEAKTTNFPGEGEIVVRPSIKARRLAYVEYTLDSDPPVRVSTTPYVFTFQANGRDPAIEHRVVARAVAEDGNDQNVGQAEQTFRLIPVVVPAPETPEAPCGPLDCPTEYLPYFILGLAGLLGLGLLAFLLAQRNRPAPKPVAAVAQVPQADTQFEDTKSLLGGQDTRYDTPLPSSFATGPGTVYMQADGPVTQFDGPATVFDEADPVAQLIFATNQATPSTVDLIPGTEVNVGKFWEGSVMQIKLNSEKVSRKHAVLAVEHGRIMLTDSSQNGTMVDGKHVSKSVPTEIKTDAKIRFADVEAQLKFIQKP